jgi:hypothetical protein
MSTLTATVDLPVTDHTVRDARVITLDLVTAWACGVSREDVALLVDDLTADVVAHAESEASVVLEVALDDDVLRIGLADGSAVRPVAAAGGIAGPHAALAHRWGHEPYRGGHRVWFELVPPVVEPAPEPADGGPRVLDEVLRAALARTERPERP